MMKFGFNTTIAQYPLPQNAALGEMRVASYLRPTAYDAAVALATDVNR